MQILIIVLPVFFIILVGYIAGKSKLVKSGHLDALNDFAYYVALPALIISSFWQIDFLQKNLFTTIGYNFLASALFAFALIFGLNLFKLSNKTKAALFLSSLVGNAIYIGFPIGKSAFGEANFPVVAGAGAVHLVLGMFLGVLASIHWTQKHNDLKKYLTEFFKNPLILALATGVVLSFLPNFGVPEMLLKNTASILGATASPVALFALGCFLSQRSHKIAFSYRFTTIALKLIVFPIFTFYILRQFNQPLVPSQISMFLAAMPTAVSTFVIAEKFELNQALVADSLLITTALSTITISTLLYFNL
ncbi:MAG: AEC family transporter [Patescibacteria group bacterium]